MRFLWVVGIREIGPQAGYTSEAVAVLIHALPQVFGCPWDVGGTHIEQIIRVDATRCRDGTKQGRTCAAAAEQYKLMDARSSAGSGGRTHGTKSNLRADRAAALVPKPRFRVVSERAGHSRLRICPLDQRQTTGVAAASSAYHICSDGHPADAAHQIEQRGARAGERQERGTVAIMSLDLDRVAQLLGAPLVQAACAK